MAFCPEAQCEPIALPASSPKPPSRRWPLALPCGSNLRIFVRQGAKPPHLCRVEFQALGHPRPVFPVGHLPRHVHVLRDGRLVLKWDLERPRAMEGVATGKLLALIRQLEDEGLL